MDLCTRFSGEFMLQTVKHVTKKIQSVCKPTSSKTKTLICENNAVTYLHI